MSTLEKVFYGLILALATSFGGLIYQAAITRVSALEVQTRAIEREALERSTGDQVSLAEVKADLRYLKLAMDRIERKLDLLPIPSQAQISPPVRYRPPAHTQNQTQGP